MKTLLIVLLVLLMVAMSATGYMMLTNMKMNKPSPGPSPRPSPRPSRNGVRVLENEKDKLFNWNPESAKLRMKDDNASDSDKTPSAEVCKKTCLNNENCYAWQYCKPKSAMCDNCYLFKKAEIGNPLIKNDVTYNNNGGITYAAAGEIDRLK